MAKMPEMKIMVNENTTDRVVILQKDAKYIIRIKNDVALSDEQIDRLINSLGRVISGEVNLTLIEFDFELIQIING